MNTYRNSIIFIRTRHKRIKRQNRKASQRRKKKKRILKHTKHSNIKPNITLLKLLIYSKNFLSYLQSTDYISIENTEETITVPTILSFKNNQTQTLRFFKKLFSSYLDIKKRKFNLDFSECTEASVSCFTILEIFFAEANDVINNYNQRSSFPIQKRFTLTGSDCTKVAKYLHIFGFCKVKEELVTENDAYLRLSLLKGKQRNYKENRKSVVAGEIVNFINKSMQGKLNCQLKPQGVNAIDSLITEVLGNAEDHSIKGSEWYVNGLSFYETQNKTDIVELNLSIINLGDSMYKGFEATKDKNNKNYDKMMKLYNNHQKLLNHNNNINKEALFTFYLLKEGFSRLKYKEPSRGNGTMNFIDAFIKLGAFGEEDPEFKSELNIISGNTIVSITNSYKPWKENNYLKLSLNKEKDVNLLPSNECLKHCEKDFPGTILECKIYLNESYFKKIINGE